MSAIKYKRVFDNNGGSSGGGGSVNSVTGTGNIQVDNTDPANPIISTTADDIIVVANYSALPAPGTVTGEFYWAENSEGSATWDWLTGSFRNSGMYYSNGVSWTHLKTPAEATQAEVDAGIVPDKFVTPATLAASTTVPHGSGTLNYLPIWSGANTLANSPLFLNGTNLGLNTLTANKPFQLQTVTDMYGLSHTDGTREFSTWVGTFGGFSGVFNGAVSNHGLALTTNDTARLYIGDTGLVSIGAIPSVSQKAFRVNQGTSWIDIGELTAGGIGGNTIYICISIYMITFY